MSGKTHTQHQGPHEIVKTINRMSEKYPWLRLVVCILIMLVSYLLYISFVGWIRAPFQLFNATSLGAGIGIYMTIIGIIWALIISFTYQQAIHRQRAIHESVDRNNSIEGRLKSLLSYLDSHFPDEEWGQYLDSDGEILWSSVIIAGHSQGAGHAFYIAKNHRVDHAVSFSWVDVRNGSLAPWLTEPFSETPPDGYYLFWHQDDTTVAKYQPALMSALDLDQFGAPVIVDTDSPPYKGSHALVATIPPPPGGKST